MKINNACICWNSETGRIRALELPREDEMRRFDLDSDFGASLPNFQKRSSYQQVFVMFTFVLNLIGHEVVDGMDAYEELMKIDECADEINVWGDVSKLS
jgi:hypothetical protein